MTTLLDRAVEAARSLSPELQDEMARLVLQLVGGDGASIALTAEERAAIASLGRRRRPSALLRTRRDGVLMPEHNLL
jgi:hypothetical protein